MYEELEQYFEAGLSFESPIVTIYGSRFSKSSPILPSWIVSLLIHLLEIGGRGGMATDFGHRYNCINRHPFAISECGMPMQLARCSECGAPIGGHNHQAVEGVSRAEHME
ncbi:hypothetical protein N7537_005910 [Penicillium hordei]|uniref:RZ-type domain-containing protein n=1 Tax=Penicillium hordei TaxID=40994 RepID=A0AAD6E6I6_9EURO|nr:uncharacterized protein N7537_005910 [Penicillium hordei]KAJ5602954.1 hypothetical protein N7537_005910 [Penicillium hordei]